MKTTKASKNRPSDILPDNLLERRLIEFSSDKSKENYIRLLDALHCTDILVPFSRFDGELPLERPFENVALKPDVMFFESLNKRLMLAFSDQTKLPPDHAVGKTVFMHCADWIKAFYTTKSDGVILNPFSGLSFVLTRDQIRILSLFGSGVLKR